MMANGGLNILVTATVDLIQLFFVIRVMISPVCPFLWVSAAFSIGFSIFHKGFSGKLHGLVFPALSVVDIEFPSVDVFVYSFWLSRVWHLFFNFLKIFIFTFIATDIDVKSEKSSVNATIE